MRISDILKKGLYTTAIAGATLGIAFSLVSLAACGSDSGSNSDEEEYGYTPSSSSVSNRADVSYKDSVVLNKKMDLNIELIKSDTTERDSSEIYIDSSDTQIPLYIGELPKGTRIKIKASTASIDEDKIRVKNEKGEYLKALTPVARNAMHADSTYTNYMVPSLGVDSTATYRDSNTFVIFNESYYYVELEGLFTDESTVRLYMQIDTAYYNYTGDTTTISMKMSDTIRGIVLESQDIPEDVDIEFSASEGYSLNLTTEGTNLDKYELYEGDSLLSKKATNIDTMFIPSDSVSWRLHIPFATVWTGPFAFFNAATRARALEKGEYFANPDSIQYPGEALLSTRPKDLPEEGIYRYNLRQEQYVWLGDYVKGDSLIISHRIENYNDKDFEAPVTYEILNKKKENLGTISSTYGGSFSVPADGPYYLHYIRLNSEPKDQVYDSLRYVLQLYTTVQQPGLLKSMSFYDEEKDEETEQINVYTGDTINFSRFSFNFTPIKATSWKEIGSDVEWFVPCESLTYLNNSSNYKASECETEQAISSDYLIATEDGAMQTAEIIAQSVADPTMRATLKVTILKAAEE